MGGFAIGALVALLWQHNANPSYKLASIPRHSANGRLGGVCARRRPATAGQQGAHPKPRAAYGSGRGRPAADGGVLNITAAVWSAGFHCWRSGNKKRTQNVSEYMLVLALCLVLVVSPVAMRVDSPGHAQLNFCQRPFVSLVCRSNEYFANKMDRLEACRSTYSDSKVVVC